MRWLGGIPVNRGQAGNLRVLSAQAMRDADGPMQLIIPPEGLRQDAAPKTGFYFIAQQAVYPSCWLLWTMAARWAVWGQP